MCALPNDAVMIHAVDRNELELYPPGIQRNVRIHGSGNKIRRIVAENGKAHARFGIELALELEINGARAASFKLAHKRDEEKAVFVNGKPG